MELAKRQGMKLMSLPLKDKSSAKVLWNDKAIDCYIVKNGKVREGIKIQGPEGYWCNEMAALLSKLQKKVIDGVDVFTEFMEAGKTKFVK